MHHDLPALLTSSEGSVHTLTGSLEDLLYEAPPGMHQNSASLHPAETEQHQESGHNRTTRTGYPPGAHPCEQSCGSQQGGLGTSAGEQNQRDQAAEVFPVVEEIFSDSSVCGSHEKEEFHDPMHHNASSPHSNKDSVSHTEAPTGKCPRQ